MNLASLTGFVTVVELGSINAAARHLGISQPALSKSIKTLEAHYAVPLLVRSRTGATPTEFGRALFQHARVVAAEMSKADQNILQMRDTFEGVIGIAVAPAPAIDLIPRALKMFSNEHPEIVISIREGVFPRAGQQLTDGIVDMAIGPTATIPADSPFRIAHLMDFPLAVVAAADHPQCRETDLRNLVDAQWLQIGGVGVASGLIQQTFLSNDLAPPVARVESHSVTCAIAMLQSSHLVSILPRNLIESATLGSGLVAVPIRQEIARNPCGLITHSARPLSRAAQILTHHIEKAAVHSQCGME